MSEPAICYTYPQSLTQKSAASPGSNFNQQGGSIFNRRRQSYEQDEEYCISCEPESTDLSGKEVTEGSLSQLSQMKRLKVLNLSRSTITDDGLKYISHMTVGKLYLGRTQITDAGIKHLARMTGLKFLSLAGTQITAGSIEHISQITGLEELYLGRTNLTDGELERLRENTTLKVTAN